MSVSCIYDLRILFVLSAILMFTLHSFPFVNINSPFIVFALGADDIFVVVDKWKNTRKKLPRATTEEIAKVCLPDAAYSTFVTSITTSIGENRRRPTKFETHSIFAFVPNGMSLTKTCIPFTYFNSVLCISGREGPFNCSFCYILWIGYQFRLHPVHPLGLPCTMHVG